MIRVVHMYWWLRGLRWKLRALRTHARMLNRRAEVEQVLMDVANGKRDLPTREECRQLAFKLGDTTR